MANGAKGDGHGLHDVAGPDGGLLHVDIRLAALRRPSDGAAQQMLRPVHGRSIIQLSAAGAR